VPERAYTAALRTPAYGARRPHHDAGMSSNTSIGRGPASGGNENHDGDPTKKTLGESVGQERPSGSDILDDAALDVPAGVPGSTPKPGVRKGPDAYPDGPNVEDSPWELDAARGNTHKP
jgi:hypothetical protein